MLLLVNHKPGKVLIGSSLIDCGRGQSLMSLASWAERWRTEKMTVKRFFLLLEKEGMITRESLRITTRITICNYARYQPWCYANDTSDDTQMIHKQHPNNNDNNDNNKESGISSINTPVSKVKESSSAQKAKNEELISKLEDGLEYKNFLIKVSEVCPYCFSHMSMPTCYQYGKLAEKYSKSEIMDMAERIENRTDLRKRYKNLGCTLRSWLKREYPERNK